MADGGLSMTGAHQAAQNSHHSVFFVVMAEADDD